MPRAVVDKQSCLSSGRCIDAAPDVFHYDDDRLAEASPAALPLEKLLAIARNCPSIAITVFDDDGNEVEL